jgi:amino-acid N-acetyltransferase
MLRIEPAASHDFASLCVLLDAVRLPSDGLRQHLRTTLVAREGEELVACVALELYGDTALLRSLAVLPSLQGSGLGRRLTEAALSLGRRNGVSIFCLLTTTATDFFVRHFGFRPVARDVVPSPVRESVEFVSACPATAQAMMLTPSPMDGSRDRI